MQTIRKSRIKKEHTYNGVNKLFFNRELSFLEFNYRVLMEATDRSNPLLERLKFISIFSSNLDEFFMIRVAGLKRQLETGVVELSMDGLTPQEQLTVIRQRVLELLKIQEDTFNNQIIPELESEGIYFHRYDDLSDSEKSFLRKYFCDCIFGSLTPLIIDSAHPFPSIVNRALNIAFVIKLNDNNHTETLKNFVQISPKIKRFIRLNKGTPNEYHFVLVENVIKANYDLIFPGYEVISANTFRVTRDCDIVIAEDEAEDLLSTISEKIKMRNWGTSVVRLEVSSFMPPKILNELEKYLDITKDDVYVVNRPLNLPDFFEIANLDIRHLRFKNFKTRVPIEFANPKKNIFDVLKETDVLVHHPYDSFTNSVLKFIKTAATDPDVISIKITLYRVGRNAPIVDALIEAAENGKEVVAFVELKARFDEESNIDWAKKLESKGVTVIYGVVGFKTHCKIALVVRNENERLKQYVHLSTGNYNSTTARIYTDIGLFTSNEDFGWDALHLFNLLTSYSKFSDWKKLVIAPFDLKNKIVELIRSVAEDSTPDEPGLIFAKLNSIAHDEVTRELYKASQKGVKIKLICRGICSVVPGIKNLSENIEVRSILGRFLEHSRIFCFKSKNIDQIYLSSADWMSRNFKGRIELMFPIENPKIKKQLLDILDTYWQDNTKSWRLLPNGTYEKISPTEGEEPFIAQDYLLEKAQEDISTFEHQKTLF